MGIVLKFYTFFRTRVNKIIKILKKASYAAAGASRCALGV